ncbi:hypothetical protein ABNQ39_14965 [Azospirillum sp. A26]
MRFDLDNLPADPALLQQMVRDLAEVVERQKADLASYAGNWVTGRSGGVL